MTKGISEFATLEDLRDFVQQTICERHQLLVGAFQFRERILVRCSKPCGLQFTLNGPRAVQFSAIWDADRRTILFYDSNGGRLHQSDLAASTGLQEEFASLAGLIGKIAA
jgi:hypothetical protein